MLPDPVDAFGRLIAEIAGIEVAAEKEDERDSPPVGEAELAEFGRLFLPPLVDVGEVARRLRFDQDGIVAASRAVRHDHRIHRDVDVAIVGLRGGDVGAEAEGARLHRVEGEVVLARGIAVAAGDQPGAERVQLALFLAEAQQRIHDGSRESIRHDRDRPLPFAGVRSGFAVKPSEQIAVEQPAEDGGHGCEVALEFICGHPRGQLGPLLHSPDHRRRDAGESGEALDGERRGGAHAEGRDDAGPQPQGFGRQFAEIGSGLKAGFDGGRCRGPRFAKRDGGGIEEPFVVEIDRAGDVFFPAAGVVEVRRHAFPARTSGRTARGRVILLWGSLRAYTRRFLGVPHG